MDHQAVAAISLAGIILDVVGGLYLAYDLLGGQHGPLRLLTRMVTYSVVFGIGYGLGLGVFFGIAAGLSVGITISLELQRVSRGGRYSYAWELVFSALRAVGFSAGLYRMLGLPFAATFAALNTAGQAVAYRRGVRPGLDYQAARHSRLTRRQLVATVLRTIGYLATAMICSMLVHQVAHAWLFALRVGLTVGLVTGFGTMVNPIIEYYADNLPARRLGAFGIWLVLCGFFFQSFQYWLVVFDIPVT